MPSFALFSTSPLETGGKGQQKTFTITDQIVFDMFQLHGLENTYHAKKQEILSVINVTQLKQDKGYGCLGCSKRMFFS